ncbi:MAG: UvrD-helicase domain-containing protein [Anaerolineae bacterium]
MLHPIVAQMHPSPEQEPAIRERGRDVVVTAGAGTGKTRTLVARYLSLLAEGLPLRAIVAVTFTKKAAREMRNRVREEVRKYLEWADLSPEERDRWQAVYAALDAARIGTIHSLCAEILRAHPAEARVDPRFDVLEEGQVNILRGRAVDEALAWATDDEEAVKLFALLGERDLRSTLDALIKQRLDAQNVFDDLPGDLLAHWQQALADRQRQALAVLLERPEWVDTVGMLQDNAAIEPDDRMELQRREALTAIWDAVGPLADRLAALARLDGINLTGGRKAAWPGGKDQLQAIKDSLRTLRDLWRSQSALLELSLTPLDKELAQALPALRAAFAFACQRYGAFKREGNALDFDDLEQGAVSLLRENDSARERWQRDVRAVLVDEFQDTNGRQRDLVTLLNGDGGKLFIVGDGKQSIYRFRGADVTVFRAERERIEQGGAAFPLETSYRAHRDLIQGLNDLLRPVLGEDADPDRPWAEPFAPLLHYREEPGPGFSPPHIELHLTVGSKETGALDRAADALVARIVGLVEGSVQVVEEGRPRPLDYGNVAILCRASTSFSAYEDALERAGVPFLTVAGRGFYGRPEIRDLLNVLQALADPTDDLALMGLLRSPAFALSDAALFHLCQECERDERSISLWDILREAGGGLSGEDGRRAERASRIIADLHGQVGRTSVADLLKALLDATDYRAGLIQAGQTRGARNVAKLLADAHASGIVGVGEFLEYVNGLRDTGTREGEARATAEGAVQIMSVHAAKGLEFPIVIIGDITHKGQERHDPLVDHDLGVLLPLEDEDGTLPAIYRLGKLRDSDQEDAESDRLLYVAATRAREKLIFSGCISLKQDGTLGSLKGWLGKAGGSEGLGLEDTHLEYDGEGASAIHVDLQVGSTPVSCTIYEPGYVRGQAPCESRAGAVPSVSLPPPLLEPVSPGIEHVDQRTSEQDRIPPQRVWRVVPAVERPRAPAWVVGSLVHKALAAWRFPDGGEFDRWAEACARGYGLTDRGQLADAVRQSRRLLLRFQAHPLYWEMDSADRRLHEVPYSLVVDGHIESGIIDALYFGGQESWRLVEFKTDDLRDENELREGVEKYIPQMRRYARAMESLLGQEPRAMLCFLGYKGGVRIVHTNPQGGSGQPLDYSLGEV